MRREWRENPAIDAAAAPLKRSLRLLIAATVLTMVIGALSQLLPAHWWMRSGMPSNPGNFIARQPINYPVCAPWTEKSADFARPDLQVTDGVSQRPAAAGDPPTVGVVLPAKARILKIYCAVGTVECSYLGCAPPLSLLATDSVYTRNRVLSLALANRAQQSSAATFRVWVVWQ